MREETASVEARSASQWSSVHSKSLTVITEPVAGGTSAARAIGSAFSRQVPSAPRIRNL